MTRPGDSRSTIRPTIGKGFFQMVFGGKSYLHCIRELIKNCRDWCALHVALFTEDRNVLRILDDGRGMDWDNRNAFASVNDSTATGPRQSGKFCTGTKQMLFSQALDVTVRTAPQSESDLVYVFSFNREEYEELVRTGRSIEADHPMKDQRSWPHEFPFGTEITYTLEDPHRRTILRGQKLAEELASILPMRYGNIVTVDGQPLPPKRIVGRPYDEVRQTPQLGEVAFEIYRPEHRSAMEDLLFTAVEIGEVPMRNFLRTLSSELRDKVPESFQLPGVCGTIRAEFLKEHVNEDRFTFDPSLADDPRTRHLVRLLVEVAPLVEQRLQLRRAAPEASAELQFEEFARRVTAVYDKAGSRPPESFENGRLEEPGDDDDGGGTVDPPIPPPPIRLSLPRREFEVGETIEIKASFRRDLASQHDLSELRWYTDRSRAKVVKQNERGVVLRAKEFGLAVVSVDVPGTALSTKTYYEVVAKRVFRITNPHPTISLGTSMLIRTRNHDLLGGLAWKLEGDGELVPQGRRAVYRATKRGGAVVIAGDPADPKVYATCDITVIGRPRKVLNIRGHWFEFSGVTLENERSIIMVRGDPFHRLMINELASGYRRAVAQNNLDDYHRHAIADEFARFEEFDLRESDPTELDPREFKRLVERILYQGDALYAELCEKMNQ